MWKAKILFLLIVSLLLFETQAQGSIFNEAPSLAERVSLGELPPVDERLPINPVVIQPVEYIGQYGGVWNLGMRRETDEAGIYRHIGYENLVRWDVNWTRVIPNVAASVTANDEATEYTFRLREGLRWSNGSLFTADDILFWYEDVFMNAALYTIYPDFRGSAFSINGSPVVVEKIDDLTVVFRFASHYGQFLQQLAQPSGADPNRFPQEYLKQFLPRYNPDIDALVAESGYANWQELFYSKVGFESSGINVYNDIHLPRLDAWLLSSSYGSASTETVIRAVRNPYYWKVDTDFNQLPYIDEVHIHLAASAADVEQMALDGLLDMQDRYLNVYDHLEEYTRVGYEFYTSQSTNSNTAAIFFNQTHSDLALRELFQNRDFRIALSYGIDRETIIQTMGLDVVPYQVAPLPTSPYFNEQLAYQYLNYDPELANSMLDGLGFDRRDERGIRLNSQGDPISFKILTIDRLEVDWSLMFSIVAEQWSALGIEAALELVERSELDMRRLNGDFEVIVWVGEGGLDVTLNMYSYTPVTLSSSYGFGWANWYLNPSSATASEPQSEIVAQMRLYDEFLASPDIERQTQLVSEILEISADQFYVMGISTPLLRQGIHRSNFRNVPPVIPHTWPYPDPAPVNPSQFYIDSQS